ncbi:DUF3618 domain-containing protein [Streptomyces sp. NPDC058372]|uniref:DUF3618 domain-containing protein n=1 Tax=unclassified Streptomyces TaxID=2593676 RepID=UPI00365CBA42
MGTTPDELRTDVEQRRARLARDVDLLSNKVTPRRIAQRKAGQARGRLTSMKERVMGSARDTTAGMKDTARGAAQSASQLTDSAEGAKDQIGDALQQGPAQARQQTQGNPIAAGLIAFGAGMLTAALMPTTEAEERVGQQLRDRSDELLEPVKREAGRAAHDVNEELRQPAAEAAEAVKSTAQEAAQATKKQAEDSGKEAGQGLRRTGEETAQEVRSRSGQGQQPPT